MSADGPSGVGLRSFSQLVITHDVHELLDICTASYAYLYVAHHLYPFAPKPKQRLDTRATALLLHGSPGPEISDRNDVDH